MSDYISGMALCPFFKKTLYKQQSIVCEGIMRGTSIHLAFANKNHMNEFAKCYCCKSYHDCLLAKMLYGKYEE